MADPVRLISAAVRDRARRGELADDGPAGAVREELRRYAEHAVASGAPQIDDERQTERRIVAELSGFGPLQPLLDDPEIEEIWINGATHVLGSDTFGRPGQLPLISGLTPAGLLQSRALLSTEYKSREAGA